MLQLHTHISLFMKSTPIHLTLTFLQRIFSTSGDPFTDRGGYRRRTEEDKGVSAGTSTGTTGSQDVTDGSTGLYRHNRQSGKSKMTD